MTFNLVTVTGPEAERITRGNIELAWLSAERQIKNGQTHIHFPSMITSVVGKKGLMELATRYNAHIKDECSLTYDPVARRWRLMPPPEFMGEPATATPTESMLVPRATYDPVVLDRPGMHRGQKADVGHVKRPMNCFMIYRKDKHAEIVAANPGTNNVGICEIIGRMWKDESPDVRMAYKAKAFRALQAHKEAHPDYNYKPRKSSEIKKRKKREALRNKGPVFNQPKQIAEAVMTELGLAEMPNLNSSARNARNQFMPFGVNPHLPWVNMSFPARVESQSLLDALCPDTFVDDASANVNGDDQLANDIANEAFNNPSAIWTWGELPAQTSGANNFVSMDNTEVAAATAERHTSLVDGGALESISEFHFDAYNTFGDNLFFEQGDGLFNFAC
uniref:MAT1-2-1 n=1 Tax=Eutiarosporella darliae TaxID=1686409 RepID=A0A2D1GT52_9PEZI|nr:MAT1-2-1 [Eutiarosporella darliae]